MTEKERQREKTNGGDRIKRRKEERHRKKDKI